MKKKGKSKLEYLWSSAGVGWSFASNSYVSWAELLESERQTLHFTHRLFDPLQKYTSFVGYFLDVRKETTRKRSTTRKHSVIRERPRFSPQTLRPKQTSRAATVRSKTEGSPPSRKLCEKLADEAASYCSCRRGIRPPVEKEAAPTQGANGGGPVGGAMLSGHIFDFVAKVD